MSSTAVTKIDPRPMTTITAGARPQAIVPTNMEDAYRMAKAVVLAKMAPKGLETPEACMIAILQGLEVGMTPMQSLQRIAVINGRPTIWGDGAIGLVRASGLCAYITEKIEGQLVTREKQVTSAKGEMEVEIEVVSDTRTAVCATQRRGEPEAIVRKFSVADAKKAGLWGKSGPWLQFPERMLQMRARAFALRDGFADVLGGLYLREEIEDAPRRGAVSSEADAYIERPTIDAEAVTAQAAAGEEDQRPSEERRGLTRLGAELIATGGNVSRSAEEIVDAETGEVLGEDEPTPEQRRKMELLAEGRRRAEGGETKLTLWYGGLAKPDLYHISEADLASLKLHAKRFAE
jgi:hypothetical protein